MSDPSVHETLRRLFDVVLREAEQNPALAQKLAQAMDREFTPQPRTASTSRPRSFNASQFHAVNVLRMHGEAALRGKLEQVKAVDDLKSVAKASGLVLSGNASRPRPSRPELIAGIIEAAKHYDAQRSAAIA
jgi:hypothetical protein